MAHYRWFDSQLVFNKWNVLIVLIVAKTLEYFFSANICDLIKTNTLFFDLLFDVLQNLIRNLSALFRLKLRNYLSEVVYSLVSIKTHLFWWFSVRRLLIYY